MSDEGADDFGGGGFIRRVEDVIEGIVRIDRAGPGHEDAATAEHHGMAVAHIPVADFQGTFEDQVMTAFTDLTRIHAH